MGKQEQKTFFDPTSERLHPHLPARPTDSEISVHLAKNNVNCPLNRIIVSSANEGNFRILHRFAFTAYTRFNRSCRGMNFGIYSPPGQGKTFIVKRWAETIGIPFVFIQCSALKSTLDLFQQICKVFEEFGVPIVEHKTDRADFLIPPCIILLDEAHETATDLQRGGLLNPMEPDDGIMHVREGKMGDLITVDCRNICWIAATTDPADLFDAFRTRFLNSIEWLPAGPEELPAIVLAGLTEKVRKNELAFVPPLDACKLISQYQAVPRLAIHGFGAQAVMQKKMMPSDTWEDVCRTVAKDMQIDEWGMTKKQVMILTALGQRPIAKARLGDICHCRSAQIESMELPGLMQYNNGGPFCLSITGRGMCITASGERELDKRGIAHNGRKVTAEYFESKR